MTVIEHARQLWQNDFAAGPEKALLYALVFHFGVTYNQLKEHIANDYGQPRHIGPDSVGVDTHLMIDPDHFKILLDRLTGSVNLTVN